METVTSRSKSVAGTSLVEVSVVVTILAILTAVMWLALGPGAKRKALETRVFSDLRQVSVGYNQYMADNDNKYPLNMRSLPAWVPRGPMGDSYFDGLAPHYAGPRTYRLGYSQIDEEDANRLRCVERWSPDKDPVALAQFVEKQSPGNIVERNYGPQGTYRTYNTKALFVPGAMLDGSAKWCRFPDFWLNQLMTRRSFGQ